MELTEAWEHETDDGFVNAQVEISGKRIRITRLGPRENLFKEVLTNLDCLTDSYQYFGSDEIFKAKLWSGENGDQRIYVRYRRTDAAVSFGSDTSSCRITMKKTRTVRYEWANTRNH